METAFATWTIVQFGCWGVAYACLKNVEAFKEKPAIAAFILADFVPVLALCYLGLQQLDLVAQRPFTLQERMYGYNPITEQVCIIQITMQFFKTVVAFVTGEKAYLKPEALGHHVVTAAAMWVCLSPPFCHSYGGIFFGLTELSTLPLNFCDTFKNFKHLRKVFPITELIAKACFALLFFILRVGLTSKVSYDFQLDLFELYASGRAHSVPAVIFVSMCNIITCGLQFYWASLIVKGFDRMFAKKRATRADDCSAKDRSTELKENLKENEQPLNQ